MICKSYINWKFLYCSCFSKLVASFLQQKAMLLSLLAYHISSFTSIKSAAVTVTEVVAAWLWLCGCGYVAVAVAVAVVVSVVVTLVAAVVAVVVAAVILGLWSCRCGCVGGCISY